MNRERERTERCGILFFAIYIDNAIVSSFSQAFDLIIRMIKNINSIQITMIKVEVKIDKSVYFVFFGLFEGFFLDDGL